MSTLEDSRLLALPYELRHRILCWAFSDRNTIELQYPLWGGEEAFAPSLFQVCRSLRTESLRAFYETRTFLWIIDLSVQHRSDPADYPALRAEKEELDDGGDDAGLLPALPWEYPHLRRDLRHLNLTIYLPPNLIADIVSGQLWFHQFPTALRRMVQALDYGRRLEELHVLFTAKRFNTRIPLEGEQIKAIEELANFRVRGRVRVQSRWDFKEAARSINGLDLPRRMKA